MPKARTRQTDPSLDLLYELRTRSYQNGANQALLARTQLQAKDCIETPWRPSVIDILAWLASLDDASTTLHNKLDQVIPFLEIVGPGCLRNAMESQTTEDLIPLGKTLDDNLTSYFAALKSLWAYLTEEAPEPISLGYKGHEKLMPHPIMTPQDLDTLIDQAADYFGRPVGGSEFTEADDVIVFLLLASHGRLRYAEASNNLCLGHVWLVDRTLTVIVERGKGGKPRQATSSLLFPYWAAKYLGWYIDLRWEQTGRNPHAHFYGGGLFTGNTNAYHRLYGFLKAVEFVGGPHELRRFGGNLGRVHGESLLDCINHFGQTTSATAPRAYLSSLCLVQWQRLYTWSDTQSHIIYPSFSTQELAVSQGVSREHARRLVHASGIERLPRQKMNLSDAAQVLKTRIQAVQRRERLNVSRTV